MGCGVGGGWSFIEGERGERAKSLQKYPPGMDLQIWIQRKFMDKTRFTPKCSVTASMTRVNQSGHRTQQKLQKERQFFSLNI